MADKEQLKLLKQGVAIWNDWRRGPLDLSIDLGGAILRRGLNLIEADLTGADLAGAHLSGADFVNTDLSRTDLTGAFLNEADLTGAHLIDANLHGAALTGADLTGADFSGASLGWSIFGSVDLSTVKGLESVRHHGPSTIGIDTIYKSRGNIPDIFLRGAGVPDSFIEYLRSLTGKAIEFYSCFISNSSKDDDLAKRLYADIQREGVRCWFAPEDLKIGDKFRTRIDEAIRVYDKLLLVLSQDSIASDWVEKEVETAFEKERQQKRTMLFPVRIDDVVMSAPQAWAADIRRTRHIGDMTRWKDRDCYQQAFERLLRDLKAG